MLNLGPVPHCISNPFSSDGNGNMCDNKMYSIHNTTCIFIDVDSTVPVYIPTVDNYFYC